jgi:hypothetical protein
MTVYYLDLKNGNDSNDGTSFANRKKTIQSFGSTPTGGDEIRIVGQPSTLVDANAKINNCSGDVYVSHSISFTFSTTTGETSCSVSSHGMKTGDLIRIWNNSSHSTHDERPNGVWQVTVTDSNNFKLDNYTAPATGSGNGYFRYLKGSQITLTNPVVKNVACYNQTGNWTASSNVTASLEASTGIWSTNTRIKSRAYSNKFVIDSAFTTGKAAYFATGTLDLSGYQQISFWVGQDSGTRSDPSNPNLSLVLCTDTQGDVGVHTAPIYTGQDTQTNQGFWRSMKTNFEANLNSSIQSVALYVDTDQGAQTVYIDNIVACKASSAADSITHDSLVGLKTSTDWPNYYLINSIVNENVLKLECGGYGTQQYNIHPVGYYNCDMTHWPIQGWNALQPGFGVTFSNLGTQTVPIYKIEPLRLKEDMDVNPTSNSGNSYSATNFSSSVSGVSTTNRITISGGWDASNSMATQYDGGYTAVSGINNKGYLWYFQSCSYADISNLIGSCGYNGIYFSSCQYNSFMNIGGTGGYYAINFSSCDYYRDMLIWGSYGQQRAINFNNCDSGNSSGTIDYDVGYGRSMFGYGGYNCIRLEYARYGKNSWDRIEAYGAMQYNVNTYDCYSLHVDRLNHGRWPGGGPSGTSFYSNRSTGMTVGIMSYRDYYYGIQSQQTEVSVDYFYETRLTSTEYSRSNGGNGRNMNQYPLYTGTSGPITINQGGITTSQYYLYYAPLKSNNLIDNYTSNHNIQSGMAWYSKNHDGVSGAVLTQYQYGSVEKETSIRHTASGVSWKIDVLNSNASSANPIQWLLTKLIVNANAAVTCKIWVYRDGTGVNGGLRVKKGAVAGVTSQVDAVITDTTVNTWVECSLTFTPTEAGAVDIFAMGYYESNASHNVYLDDFSATQA